MNIPSATQVMQEALIDATDLLLAKCRVDLIDKFVQLCPQFRADPMAMSIDDLKIAYELVRRTVIKINILTESGSI